MEGGRGLMVVWADGVWAFERHLRVFLHRYAVTAAMDWAVQQSFQMNSCLKFGMRQDFYIR